MPLWTPAYEPSQTYDLWLDASDEPTITESGGDVSQWDDKSGYGRDAVQATGSYQPITGTRTIGGLNAIDFLASKIKSTFSATLTQPNTIFAVCKSDVSSDGNPHFVYDGIFASARHVGYKTSSDLWALYAGTTLSGSAPDTSEHLFSHVYNTTSSEFFIDGTSDATGNGGSQSLSGLMIGDRYTGDNSRWNGLISEIIVVDGLLSDAERQKIEGYLAWKWGLEANLPSGHPYEFGPPIVNGWTPANEPSLTYDLWLDASDASTITESGGDVSQWDDKSGNNNDAVQATGANQPETDSVTIGGLNAIDFNGTSDYLDNASGLGADIDSLFIVLKTDAAYDETTPSALAVSTVGDSISAGLAFGSATGAFANEVITLLDETLPDIFVDRQGISSSVLTSGVNADPHLYSLVLDTNWFMGLDGSDDLRDLTSGTRNSLGFANSFNLGCSGRKTIKNLFLDGSIAEVICLSSAVSTADRQKIEGYLAWKWGLQANLPSGHPYEFAPPFANGWTPANEPSLTYDLWLDASDASTITESGGDVSQWDDKSGNNNDAVQSVGAQQPTTGSETLNSLNVLTFSSHNMLVPQLSGLLSAFIVIEPDVITGNQRFLSQGGSAAEPSGNRFFFRYSSSKLQQATGAGNAVTGSTTLTAVPMLLGVDPTRELWLDGTSDGTGSAMVSLNAPYDFNISGYFDGYGEFANGKYAEIIIVTGTLSTAERQRIEGYLAWKWGLVANLPSGHPYEFGPPLIGRTLNKQQYGQNLGQEIGQH